MDKSKTLKSIKNAIVSKKYYGEGRIVAEKILNFKKDSKKKHHKEVITLKDIYKNTPRDGKEYIRRANDHLGWATRMVAREGVKLEPVEEKNGLITKIKVEF